MLKTVEEYESSPTPFDGDRTGVACPKCGEELVASHVPVISAPHRANVVCSNAECQYPTSLLK